MVLDRPYLASTQRPNREVEKPVESTEKFVSIVFKGRLLCLIIWLKYDPRMLIPKYEKIEL